MIDIKILRENPELIKLIVKNKKKDIDIDLVLSLDLKKRILQTEIEELNRRRNEVAKNQNHEEGKILKDKITIIEDDLKIINDQFDKLFSKIPNIYSEDTPIGVNEDENVVIRSWGETPKFNFKPKEHFELGEKLGILDIETAGKVTGSRFAYIKGKLVNLQFAIIQYTFNVLTNVEIIAEIIKKNNLHLPIKPFLPVLPPVFVKMEVMDRMARLHPMDERYCFPEDNQCLVGSAEHTLGPIHMDQIINEKELPIRYIGYSTAFRREAGTYGKDTKGILRVHQFDKLEMESFCLPENGKEEQDLIVGIQEYLMQSIKLPYHVVQICTGDMGGPDFRQIDIETYMPGQGRYRETHTSDYMTDYQSRRLSIKAKRLDGKKDYIHMNDATAFAIGRILIAIIENYQTEEGYIKIPDILIPYMNGETIIK